MAKYRTKPVVIDAMRFTEETKDRVFHWITCNCYPDRKDGQPILVIQTLEGDMIASLGDYIIKGVLGEFYPCKPEAFEAKYEEING